jgi:acyl carrier protein
MAEAVTLTYESLENIIMSAVCDACNVDRAKVDLQTRLFDIGFDSVSLTGVMARVEADAAYEMDVKDVTAAFRAVSVGDLVNTLHAAVQQAQDEQVRRGV